MSEEVSQRAWADLSVEEKKAEQIRIREQKERVTLAMIDIARLRLFDALDGGSFEETDESIQALVRVKALSEQELALARRSAREILNMSRPMCQWCHGRGVLKKPDQWYVCFCVNRKFVDNKKTASQPVIPGRRKQKTEQERVLDQARIADAEAILVRATKVREEALRPIDLKISEAPSHEEADRLMKERDRIARHHQPKIEKAERRLKRLAYLTEEKS